MGFWVVNNILEKSSVQLSLKQLAGFLLRFFLLRFILLRFVNPFLTLVAFLEKGFPFGQLEGRFRIHAAELG